MSADSNQVSDRSDGEMTTVVVNLTKGEKRRLMIAHKAARQTWNKWALAALERAARDQAVT